MTQSLYEPAPPRQILEALDESPLHCLASKPVFDGWQSLGQRVMMLAQIVQNDRYLPYRKLADWRERTDALLEEFLALKRTTLLHITECQDKPMPEVHGGSEKPVAPAPAPEPAGEF